MRVWFYVALVAGEYLIGLSTAVENWPAIITTFVLTNVPMGALAYLDWKQETDND